MPFFAPEARRVPSGLNRTGRVAAARESASPARPSEVGAIRVSASTAAGSFWQPALAAHLQRFKHCFRRKESLDHCQKYVLGLLMELKRKSVEPIALATEVPVRTLQEFLAFFAWDHQRVSDTMQVLVAEEHASDHAIGLVDASAHPKSGDKTPGVARQWCGRTGRQGWTLAGYSCLVCSVMVRPAYQRIAAVSGRTAEAA